MKRYVKRIAALLVLVAMVLSMLPSAAFAVEPDVSYLDADGNMQICSDYQLLNSSSGGSFAEGWYVVAGDVVINGKLDFVGEVNLIVTNGSRLTVNGRFESTSGVTIYSQTNDEDLMGEVVVTGGWTGQAVFGCVSLVLNGCRVTVNAVDESYALNTRSLKINNSTIATFACPTTPSRIRGSAYIYGPVYFNDGILNTSGIFYANSYHQGDNASLYAQSGSFCMTCLEHDLSDNLKILYRMHDTDAFQTAATYEDIPDGTAELRIIPRIYSKTHALISGQLFMNLPSTYIFDTSEADGDYRGIFKTGNPDDMDIDLYVWDKNGETYVDTVEREAAQWSEIPDVRYHSAHRGMLCATFDGTRMDDGVVYRTKVVLIDAVDQFAELVFWMDRNDENAQKKYEAAFASLAIVRAPVVKNDFHFGTCVQFHTDLDYVVGNENYYTKGEDGRQQIGYYYRAADELGFEIDFDVYQWPVTLAEPNVAAAVWHELAKYPNFIVPHAVLDAPVPMAYYNARDAWEAGDEVEFYNTRTYIFQHAGYFYEIVFWLNDGLAVTPGYYAAVENYISSFTTTHTFNADGVCTKCGDLTDEDIGDLREDFVGGITLHKNYRDVFNPLGVDFTKINETLEFVVTPMSLDAPAFESNTVKMYVRNGVGEVDIKLPTHLTAVGEYWYQLVEKEGSISGVTYNTRPLYLHIYVDIRHGDLGIIYATLHYTPPMPTGEYINDAEDKTDTVTNGYGEGTLRVRQFVDINSKDLGDKFEVTVTFDSHDKLVESSIMLNDAVAVAGGWTGTKQVVVSLGHNDIAEFTNIPAGVTYTVQQTESNYDAGYSAPVYTLDDNEPTERADDFGAYGTINDLLDIVNITNEKNLPIDVGVVLENVGFVAIALAGVAMLAVLALTRKKKYEAE